MAALKLFGSVRLVEQLRRIGPDGLEQAVPIDDLARSTTTTTPIGAGIASDGVNATCTRTPIR